jgi:hypothetical protein
METRDMTSLNRAVRQRTPFTVVRVRRIKHRTPTSTAPRSRDPAQQDLSSLIFYGQG